MSVSTLLSVFHGAEIIETGVASIDLEDSLLAMQEEESYDWTWIDGITTDSETSDEEEDVEIDPLEDELCNWYNTHNGITHMALSDLLKILRTREVCKNLPLDSRTLLNTPRSVCIDEMSSGTYWYNSIKSTLISYYAHVSKNMKITLQFHIDGLRFGLSTKVHFWPILFRIIEEKEFQPRVIAIYCGESKPDNLNAFLDPFVTEMNELINNGIIINNYKVTIGIHSFICDSPARSFIKGIVYFNHHQGCSKCTVIGSFDTCMNFPNVDAQKRDDIGFRSKRHPGHHKKTTPLEKLPIDMIEQFPISDSLHLLDQGVMKRLLEGWINGKFNFRTKFSSAQCKEITKLLAQANETRPIELHRKIRPLDSLHLWKGTEFRTFLLYLGVVILRDFVNSEVYYHFLLLFCSITIYYTKYYSNLFEVAKEMITDYVKSHRKMYGNFSIVSNVHNLLHIYDDVQNFGDLQNISTYPYENYLGKLKRLVRSGNRPLAQVAKRLLENRVKTKEMAVRLRIRN
uniref:Transposase domain-containing protein n=1 Tax=Lutzomyia longipalpis TaxID=7200 RepID=A0A1B0CU09_LUTLO